MILPTTLSLAAAAAVINFWLARRIGALRRALRVSVGDGGNPALMRRMRAQANFGEQVPITLILFALVDMAGKAGLWLTVLGGVFLLGRVAHALAMDEGSQLRYGRTIGMITSLGTQLVLVIVAVGMAAGKL